jgi:hypothetical protein
VITFRLFTEEDAWATADLAFALAGDDRRVATNARRIVEPFAPAVVPALDATRLSGSCRAATHAFLGQAHALGEDADGRQAATVRSYLEAVLPPR